MNITEKTISARERQAANPGKIPVMEHYYTLQGEGAWTGTAAHFIRLAGCDVGCVWCDVKESWEIGEDQWMDLEAIADLPVQSGADRVVLTGGEPAMYNLTALTAAFRPRGMKIHIETSGAYPFSGDFDWITFSPKKFKAPHPSIYPVADELKVVVYHPSDLDFAALHAAKVGENCELRLQPEWSKSSIRLPELVDYIKSNPSWKISLQTHKFMDIP